MKTTHKGARALKHANITPRRIKPQAPDSLKAGVLDALRAWNAHADAYHGSRHASMDATYTHLAKEQEAKAATTTCKWWRTRYLASASHYKKLIGQHPDERRRYANPELANAVTVRTPCGVDTYDHVEAYVYNGKGEGTARVLMTGSVDEMVAMLGAVQGVVLRTNDNPPR